MKNPPSHEAEAIRDMEKEGGAQVSSMCLLCPIWMTCDAADGNQDFPLVLTGSAVSKDVCWHARAKVIVTGCVDDRRVFDNLHCYEQKSCCLRSENSRKISEALECNREFACRQGRFTN